MPGTKLAILPLALILLAGCIGGDSIDKEKNTVRLGFSGHALSCMGEPKISVFDETSNGWGDAKIHLPEKGSGVGMIVVDGKEQWPGWCDLVVCHGIERPTLLLNEYVKVNEDINAENGIKTEYYNTGKIIGKIRIEYPYYLDPFCIVPATYKTEVLAA